MGFYPQPNDFTCGPFALKHALVAIGKPADEDEIASIAHTHARAGTDELGLARAARAYDCDLHHERTLSAERARRILIEQLRSRMPALLCVDDWGHWLTAVRHDGGRFILIDSNEDPVLTDVSWAQLERRWRYFDTDYDEDDPPAVYDYLALQPRFRVGVKADFSLARLRILRRTTSQGLAKHWDSYLEDLLQICRPKNAKMQGAQTLGEFLRRNQELLVSRIVYWHGEVTRTQVTRVLYNLRFVAETYGLVIPSAAARQAVADLAMLITLAAVAIGGIGDIYGLGTLDS